MRPLLALRPAAARRAAPAVQGCRSYALNAAAAAAAGRQHPEVDVGGLLGNAPLARRGEALRAMSAALLPPGGTSYFYVRGVDEVLGGPEYVQEIYALSRRMHGLPAEVKARYAGLGGSSKVGVVYSGSDVGQAEPAYDPKSKASARSWDFSRHRRGEEEQQQVDKGNTAPVDDGDEAVVRDFARAMDGLYERQNAVGAALLTAFAEVVGLPPHTFEPHFSQGDMGTIRLIHYPGDAALPPGEGADVGISPHTDFEAFTLMHQSAPGLQFMPPPGRSWVDAPVRDSEYVVIVGDVLERFTNGMLRATPHRVLHTSHPRFSIIRFNAVAPETLVEPLAAFVTPERPRAYTSCTMRQHMETTLRNLELGLGSWDMESNTSLSARYRY